MQPKNNELGHDPKAAYEQGRSDGEFDGIDTFHSFPCHCRECERQYNKGYDEGCANVISGAKK